MNALKYGDKSAAVREWQNFLFGAGYKKVVADGDFGKNTKDATIDFQKKNELAGTGIVDNQTYAKAMQLNFELVKNPADVAMTGPNWPPPPDFKALTYSQVQALFGKIEFKLQANGSNVTITNNWVKENMVTVEIPQLANKPPYFRKKFNFHKKAAPQFQKLFIAWEKAKLIDRILTFDGDFNPRLIKGSTSLSNHSFGTGFDINASTNGLGVIPALVGKEGCVRELVPIANKLGFYWGGHFTRKDGMHFEIAKII
ncbi:MAG: M15 family metallopeptidase [Bacteroidota bacterium]